MFHFAVPIIFKEKHPNAGFPFMFKYVTLSNDLIVC